MCYVLKSWANVGQKGCDKRKLRGIARWGKKGLQKGKVGVMRGLVFPLRREALRFNLRGEVSAGGKTTSPKSWIHFPGGKTTSPEGWIHFQTLEMTLPEGWIHFQTLEMTLPEGRTHL